MNSGPKIGLRIIALKLSDANRSDRHGAQKSRGMKATKTCRKRNWQPGGRGCIRCTWRDHHKWGGIPGSEGCWPQGGGRQYGRVESTWTLEPDTPKSSPLTFDMLPWLIGFTFGALVSSFNHDEVNFTGIL